jgi:hypothetical protein
MQTLREVTGEIELEAVTPEQKTASTWLLRALLAGLVIGVAVFLVIWSAYSERRAVLSLPAAERQALYSRTVQNLSSVCATDRASMRSFCEEQAHLAKAFPECDADCYRLAERQLSRVQLPR